MKREPEPETKTYKQLRDVLRTTVYKELLKLPELIEGMETKERLEILVKIMPFALPKLETMSATVYEPIQTEW